jgi:hypothetical protein
MGKLNTSLYKESQNIGVKFIGNILEKLNVKEECICHKCIEEKNIKLKDSPFLLNSSIMILCPICGNKRCPHASDHDLACTASNDSGQPGSIYG